MSGRLPRSLGLAALVALIAHAEGAALAQTAPAASAPPGTPAAPAPSAAPPADSASPPAAAPAPSPAAAAGSPAPAGSAAPSKDSAAKDSALTGYGYSPRRAAPPPVASDYHSPHYSSHYGRLAHHANEAVATFAGFEMLADGGSRLFVQLSRQVDVEQERGPVRATAAPRAQAQRKTKRAHAVATGSSVTLTFLMKGTEVVQRNNENALVTVHFNTPVVRARLLPAGADLRFVVEMRADVTPQMKVVAAKDNGAILQIDFPQGSYLPAGADTAEDLAGHMDQAAPSAPSGANNSMGPD